MEAINAFVAQYGALMAQGTWDAIVMTVLSTLFAYVIGIPVGVLLVLTEPGGLHPHRVFNSLAEIDGGLVEAAQSFGASTWQIISKVLLPESMPSLVRGLSITFITLFGFVAMAGTVGAGGIGDIAIRYGYQRYQDDVMVVAIVLCVIIVQIAQSICSAIARKIDHRVR